MKVKGRPIEGSPQGLRYGAGCATLFALPFLLGGLAALAGGISGATADSGEGGDWILVVMGLLFSAVGVGVPFAAWWGVRSAIERQRLAQENPGKPWMWRADWASGRVRCATGHETIFAWVFAVFWNTISWTFVALAGRDMLEEGPAALLLLIFPLIGLGLLTWAIVATLRRRKYGSSELTLGTIPGVVGGRLAGRIETNLKEPPSKGVRLDLECTMTTGSGKNSTTRTLWTSEDNVPAMRLSQGWQGVSIPVDFGIPSACRPTADGREGGGRVNWRLRASADTPGLDFSAAFEVPVFWTEASRDGVGEVEARTANRPGGALPAWNPAEALFVERSGPRGEPELHFPSGKRRKEAFALFVFTVLWMSGAAAIFYFDGPLWFALPWMAIGLLMFYGVVSLLFESTTIRVSGGQLQVESVLLGWRRVRSAPVAEIEAVQPVAGGANQGSSSQAATMWWDIQAQRADGSSALALGRSTSSIGEAEAIAAWARRACGIR